MLRACFVIEAIALIVLRLQYYTIIARVELIGHPETPILRTSKRKSRMPLMGRFDQIEVAARCRLLPQNPT